MGFNLFIILYFYRGQSVGTNSEECPKSSDQCYKIIAEASVLAKLKMAGCSTFRCMVKKL